MRVGRAFQLKEHLRAELSGDMSNALNRTNIKDLNTLYRQTTSACLRIRCFGFNTPP